MVELGPPVEVDVLAESRGRWMASAALPAHGGVFSPQRRGKSHHLRTPRVQRGVDAEHLRGGLDLPPDADGEVGTLIPDHTISVTFDPRRSLNRRSRRIPTRWRTRGPHAKAGRGPMPPRASASGSDGARADLPLRPVGTDHRRRDRRRLRKPQHFSGAFRRIAGIAPITYRRVATAAA